MDTHVSKPNRKPTFFWQGLLIVLPVIALAIMGVVFLQQDKSLVAQQAKENAQRLSDEIARYISSQLDQHIHRNEGKVLWPSSQTNLNARRSTESDSVDGKSIVHFDVPLQPYRELVEGYLQSGVRPRFDGPIVAMDGELLEPPSYGDVPSPTVDALEKLSSEQRRMWVATPKTTNIWRAFLNARPPEPFATRAMFSLALLLKTNEPVEAEKLLSQLSNSSNIVLTASGLPLSPLATLELVRLQMARGTNDVSPESVARLQTNLLWLASCSLTQPSSLTPALLDESIRIAKEVVPKEVRQLETSKEQWATDELRRELFSNLSEIGAIQPDQWNLQSTFWIDWKGVNRLVSVYPVETKGKEGPVSGYGLRAEAEAMIEVAVLELLDQSRIRLPPYASIAFEVCGKTFPKLPARPKEFPYWVSGPWLDLGSVGYIDLLSKKTGATHSTGKESYNFEFSPADMPLVTNVTEVLAQTVETWEVEKMKVPGFKVQIRLAQPKELFAIQQKRVLIFGSLIAFAAVVALVGFVTAHRAFERQLRLNEMKSNFVSSVSHELRAPIASIRLMAEGLERGKVSEPRKQREYFRFIMQECRRLSSLIENVLDFSRIEQGRKQYEFEPTDIVKLTSETVKLMEPYAEEEQVSLQCAIHPQIIAMGGQATVDGRAMQQALINLIDNAIKHSPGGTSVKIVLEQTGTAISLSVADNGPGIPQAEQEKIFERFYRLGSELRRETQGVGIGLSIVKHIVDAHGGKIVVRSAPGQGSCFTIELPIGNQHENA